MVSDIVSQYHQRLFVIDTQVQYNDRQSLQRFGQWLRRKWFDCQSRLSTAQEEVRDSGVSPEELRAEWVLQVKAQTKPIPRKCLPYETTELIFQYRSIAQPCGQGC